MSLLVIDGLSLDVPPDAHEVADMPLTTPEGEMSYRGEWRSAVLSGRTHYKVFRFTNLDLERSVAASLQAKAAAGGAQTCSGDLLAGVTTCHFTGDFRRRAVRPMVYDLVSFELQETL